MSLQQVTEGQANPEVVINRNSQTLEHQGVYGQRQSAHSGLTWGYYGGRWGGNSVADGTLTLTNSTTNYVVVARATGVISVNTTVTNWNNTTDYARVYRITTAGGVVTNNSTTADFDYRVGPFGVHGQSDNSGGSVALSDLTDVDIGSPSPADGDVLTYESSSGTWIAAAPSAGGDVTVIPIACSDETTALTTGTAKVTFRMPFAMTLTDVRASVTTAPTGGTLLTVDVNEAGSTILSTKLTFDASEKTTKTAATPRVISDSSLADDAEMTIDIDAVGSTIAGAGLKVYLIGYVT